MNESKESTKLTESSVVVASDHQTSAQVGEENVILDLEEGTYYGLNPTGSRIWEIIQDPIPVEEVISTVVSEYDIKRERCSEYVTSFIKDLEDRDLVSSK